MAITPLHLLCAGAAQGLVKSLQGKLRDDTSVEIDGRFGAVGGLKEALLGGAPCDLMVTTETMVDELVRTGWLRGEQRTPIGRVRTGVAVRRGAATPDVSTPEALKAALLAADAIFLPDPERATAGIHFVKVLRELGIVELVQPRLRAYPGGAIAMAALAASEAVQPIGCTQLTEILYTEGVELVAPLPPRFELATVYSAAVAVRAPQPELAGRLMSLLTDPQAAALRAAGGFE